MVFEYTQRLNSIVETLNRLKPGDVSQERYAKVCAFLTDVETAKASSEDLRASLRHKKQPNGPSTLVNAFWKRGAQVYADVRYEQLCYKAWYDDKQSRKKKKEEETA